MQINQNLRSLVFGNSCKDLFSFGVEDEKEKEVEVTKVEDKSVKDLFEGFGTLYFFPKKNGIYKNIQAFCRQKYFEELNLGISARNGMKRGEI
jgi:hypothetical protein